jgi:5-methylcytosine-specific restriction protein A
MPRAPARPCTWHGCAALVDDGGRCPAHRREAEQVRGSAARRGYGKQWRDTRIAYLAAHPWCAHLGCINPATDVDHIDGLGPLAPRGHDWANLRALCHPHHSQRTARDQPGGWNAR